MGAEGAAGDGGVVEGGFGVGGGDRGANGEGGRGVDCAAVDEETFLLDRSRCEKVVLVKNLLVNSLDVLRFRQDSDDVFLNRGALACDT